MGTMKQKARVVELLAQGHSCADCFSRLATDTVWEALGRVGAVRRCRLGDRRAANAVYHSRPCPPALICRRWSPRVKGL